jgi:hypothetical protein
MLQKSKIMRAFALSAFAVMLLSAPFISTAKADSGHRGLKNGYWAAKEQRWGHDHHRHQVAHKHFRQKQAQKHRRRHHAKKAAYRHDHHATHRATRKIVRYEAKPSLHRLSEEQLVARVIEAVVAATFANPYR